MGFRWRLLAGEVLRICGNIPQLLWEVAPALHCHRDPEEIGKEEQAAAEEAVPKKAFPSFRNPRIYCDSTLRSRSGLKGLQVPSCLSSVAVLTTSALCHLGDWSQRHR